MANLISVSTAPAAELGGKNYYDLIGTLEVMKRIYGEFVVDGFELQFEPEWDRENPPLTDTEFADWTKTPKFEVAEILSLVKKMKLPIISVHASRDVGNYLCSNRPQDLEKGKRVICNSLSLASELGARICVFHLWDTWSTGFDVNRLNTILFELATQYPRVKAAVENIPTHLRGCTPFSLVSVFDYVTLDLKWAALYDEFDSFESIVDRVANVHLRGRLNGSKWALSCQNFTFDEALGKLRNEWKYPGPLTVEPEGRLDESLFENFLEAMRSLRP